MLEIERKNYIFKTKEIWFSDYPYDIKDYHSVVFYDCKNKVNAEGFNCEEHTTLVIDLTQDLDTIWQNMSRGSCRRPIKRAEGEGIKIKLNQNYDEFYEMYCSIRKTKGLSYIMELEDIKKYGTVFAAELRGEIISGTCYLEDQNNMRAWVAGSKRFEGDEAHARTVADASKLVVWQAINYAKEKGIKEFDMGGYYTGKVKDEQKERINIFKQRFGGKLTTRYIYEKDYSKVYKLANKVYQSLQGGIK